MIVAGVCIMVLGLVLFIGGFWGIAFSECRKMTVASALTSVVGIILYFGPLLLMGAK
jgi:hypothetical protein